MNLVKQPQETDVLGKWLYAFVIETALALFKIMIHYTLIIIINVSFTDD